ncbi:uronyl 2-sulfotransferase-like [Zootermopsis nevadensis]|uniref:Heparan sulfate 2-O-sulfotransferase pipe n=1 Tax=Zootermopsis nevadensis TaxID=136037 RepID=A0A067R0P5_ZOONE|nr:uronyl 2-sulfotransferase-like [Zootermopsis nevadensis]KDR15463.1 Heparan sulfate 2-O-sulfotransferase pipe [Zootermopsis nevadensis]
MIHSRRFTYPWFLIIVALMAGTGMLILNVQNPWRKNDILVTKAKFPVVTPSVRRITKSLTELRQDARVPELSGHVLFFNRVPKSGSEMLVLLLQWLQGANSFRHIRLGGGNVRKLNRIQQEELVETVTRKVRDEAVPVTFDRHVYFLNFSHFDRQSPTYINLVRDPVEKAASRFYYARVTPNPRSPDLQDAPQLKSKEFRSKSFDDCVQSGDPECAYNAGKTYDLTIPYFCGHQDWCTLLNEQRALETAKANVERYFPVVGILEELNATLALLEKRLPYFFRGVQKIYFQDLMEPRHNRNPKRPQHVSRSTRKYLEKALDSEYDFYYWLRARLLQQRSALTPHQ